MIGTIIKCAAQFKGNVNSFLKKIKFVTPDREDKKIKEMKKER